MLRTAMARLQFTRRSSINPSKLSCWICFVNNPLTWTQLRKVEKHHSTTLCDWVAKVCLLFSLQPDFPFQSVLTILFASRCCEVLNCSWCQHWSKKQRRKGMYLWRIVINNLNDNLHLLLSTDSLRHCHRPQLPWACWGYYQLQRFVFFVINELRK